MRPRVTIPADGLPIPVERFGNDFPADALACSKCGASRIAEEDEMYCSDPITRCEEHDCSGWMEWAYLEADDKCPNCERLGWWSWQKGWAYGKACSRPCFLQAEYAESLKERAA